MSASQRVTANETAQIALARFVRERLRLAPPPGFPELHLHLAHPGSGLWRLAQLAGEEAEVSSPYWAYVWAGGAVLARHIMTCPETVAGKRILDVGAGSGIVGIAAVLAGADQVLASEIDPLGRIAIALNAAANDAMVELVPEDVTTGPMPEVDVVLAGDVFYDLDVAARMTRFFDRCAGAGIDVLVGDPGRKDLPGARLVPVASYQVADFGDSPGTVRLPSTVFAWRDAGR